MIPFFLSYETTDLKEVGIPFFQPLPGNSTHSNFSNRENTDILFHYLEVLGKIVPPRKERFYRNCYISVEQSIIENAHAFGFSSKLGSGGFLFAENSQVYFNDAGFSKCVAPIGGTLSVHNSDLFIYNSFFRDCHAFYECGAIQCVSKGPVISKAASEMGKVVEFAEAYYSCFLRNASFTRCVADEFFGAAGFSNMTELVISQSLFYECSAGHSAGALGLFNTMSFIFESGFYQNRCGRTTFDKDQPVPIFSKGDNPLYAAYSIKQKHRPKGGGAILVVTSKPPEVCVQVPNIELSTVHCCFVMSEVYDITHEPMPGEIERGANVSPVQKGADILFGGFCYYRSYTDVFTYPQNVSIGEIEPNRLWACLSTHYTGNNQQLKCGLFKWFIETEFVPESQTCKFWKDGETSYGDIVELDLVSTSPRTYTLTQLKNQEFSLNDDTNAESYDPQATQDITTPPTPFIITTRSVTEKYKTSSLTVDDYDQQHFASNVQSMTPSMSFTPTCSTYGQIPQKIETLCTECEGKTNFPFIHSPSVSLSASVTSTGASWPIQTEAKGTPTCSTGTNFIDLPAKPTASWWGEIPHPSATPTNTFFGGIPLATERESVTSTGATWPKQTYTPLNTRIPTMSPEGDKPKRSFSTVTQSWWGENPNPTRTASISFFFEASASSPPTKTTVEEGKTISITKTLTWVPSLTLTYSYFAEASALTNTETILYVESESIAEGDHPIWVSSLTNFHGTLTTLATTYGAIPTFIPATTFADNAIVINIKPNTKEGLQLWMLIVIVVASVIVIAVIGTLIWWFSKKKRKSSSDGPIEMVDETIVQDSSTAPVTHDNPLWTSNVEDTDDPFRNDFEEDTVLVSTSLV